MIPEIILAIPLNNNPIETKIIVITMANPGYAKRIAAKPMTIPPMIIFAIREALPSDLDTAPLATKPKP